MPSPKKSDPGTNIEIAEPPADCALCPRLTAFREESRAKQPGWFNGAVPSFGEEAAQLLIVGLAPGLKGANRTGRPFTGDYAGDLLYPTLIKFGFAAGNYQADPGDGLTLKNCMITNAVRCVPPQNKPIGAEINQCRPFLKARIEALPRLQLIITLGRIAHDQVIRAMGGKLSAFTFGHNAHHQLPGGIDMLNSYHCSRYNTNTGRLTTEMFELVFENAASILAAKA